MHNSSVPCHYLHCCDDYLINHVMKIQAYSPVSEASSTTRWKPSIMMPSATTLSPMLTMSTSPTTRSVLCTTCQQQQREESTPFWLRSFQHCKLPYCLGPVAADTVCCLMMPAKAHAMMRLTAGFSAQQRGFTDGMTAKGYCLLHTCTANPPTSLYAAGRYPP